MSTKVKEPEVKYDYREENPVKKTKSGYIGKVFQKPSRAKQCYRDECDIRHIMRKYRSDGVIPRIMNKEPLFGDFRNINIEKTFETVMNVEEAFSRVDPLVRKRFENDPVKMMEFVTNKENKEEAIRLGLINKPAEVSAPASAPSTTAPAASGGAGKAGSAQ